MSKSRLVSGRIKKVTGVELSADRYEYLDLANAEPDLGLPAVDESVLIGDINGTRTWVDIATYADEFKGFTGSQGDVGFTGSQGDIGYTGSQGDIGYTGSQGEVGFVGSQGLQGNFGGVTFDYTFDSAIDDADPGVGKLRLNNTATVSALQLYIHDTDDANANLDAYLTTIDDSTSQLKGHVRISNKADSNDFAIFSITGVSTNNTTYFTVPVAFVSGTATGFDNLEDIIITFARTGDKGDIGFVGSQGDVGFTGSQGDIGYTGSQGIQGDIGFTGSAGADGVIGVDGAQGDVGFTGSQGVQGDIGFTGSQGDLGYTGSQGDVGFTGSQGVQGDVGFAGSQGDIGYTGSTGPEGVGGATGLTGDTGFTGSQGDIGYTGSKGDIGLEPWKVINSDYTAGNRDRLIANGISGSFNITLPTTPTVGDYIQITDGANFNLYPITILRNGNTIEGFSENVLLDLPGSTFEFIYDGATWQLTSTTGPQGFTGSAGAGFTGSQGEPGIPGEFAGIGFTGSAGAGFTGSQGDVGFVGSMGDTGDVGFSGSRGSNGNRSVALAQEGLLIARTGVVRWYAPADLTVQEITLRLDTPADQIATIVIKKSGVATRTINISTGQVKAVNSNAFAMTADEYLTVDVTANGSPGAGTQGSGLNVVFLYQFSSL